MGNNQIALRRHEEVNTELRTGKSSEWLASHFCLWYTCDIMAEETGWRIEERRGLRYYCLNHPAIRARGGALIQGVFTRQGGVSREPWGSLNVGHTVGDDTRAVEVNHHRICQALDIPREAITTAHQVHGARVGRVGAEDQGTTLSSTDGLITDVPDVALMLRFADCVPLLFFDPHRPAVGLAHAGWRGTLAGIARKVVRAMAIAFNSQPEELIAGIGPSIGPCCYQIGWDLADRVQAQFPQWPDLIHWRCSDRPYLDLWRANQRQLEEAGVRSIALAQRCTACRVDEFFSHRAEGGRTGRFAVVIGLRGA
ncbi:MAG: peptidoglycan editing factor PgeF [Chloroflexota bacterium]|nr:peptidoglycan editing factor PgeF [Chloroflexota bacterium]